MAQHCHADWFRIRACRAYPSSAGAAKGFHRCSAALPSCQAPCQTPCAIKIRSGPALADLGHGTDRRCNVLPCVRQAAHTPHRTFFLSCSLLEIVQACEGAQGCEAVPVAPSKGGCNGQHQCRASQTCDSRGKGVLTTDEACTTGAVLFTRLQCSPAGSGELGRHQGGQARAAWLPTKGVCRMLSLLKAARRRRTACLQGWGGSPMNT